MFENRTFTVVDPRTMEGNPYEAAERACGQLEAMLAVMEALMPATRIIVRNAELERQMLEGSPRPLEWEQGPHGRRFDAVAEDIVRLRREFAMQRQAAGFDPKAKL